MWENPQDSAVLTIGFREDGKLGNKQIESGRNGGAASGMASGSGGFGGGY